MKIDNMREEHQERLIQNAEKLAREQKEAERSEEKAAAGKEQAKENGTSASGTETKNPRKPYGFIAVSVGEGMGEIFKGIGADYLIEGGQTMNPSTEDMLLIRLMQTRCLFSPTTKILFWLQSRPSIW